MDDVVLLYLEFINYMAINYFQVKYSEPVSSLTSRLRGSDSDEGFVIPVEAGNKHPFRALFSVPPRGV